MQALRPESTPLGITPGKLASGITPGKAANLRAMRIHTSSYTLSKVSKDQLHYEFSYIQEYIVIILLSTKFVTDKPLRLALTLFLIK